MIEHVRSLIDGRNHYVRCVVSMRLVLVALLRFIYIAFAVALEFFDPHGRALAASDSDKRLSILPAGR